MYKVQIFPLIIALSMFGALNFYSQGSKSEKSDRKVLSQESFRASGFGVDLIGYRLETENKGDLRLVLVSKKPFPVISSFVIYVGTSKLSASLNAENEIVAVFRPLRKLPPTVTIGFSPIIVRDKSEIVQLPVLL